MIPLKAGANNAFTIGPFLDTNLARKAGLTITNTDVHIKKFGGSWGTKNSGSLSDEGNGFYSGTWNTTDMNTIGILEGYVDVAGAYPRPFKFFVYPSHVYNVLMDVEKWDGHFVEEAGQGAGAQDITLASGRVGTDSFKLGSHVKIMTAANSAAVGQVRGIISSKGTSSPADQCGLDRPWDVIPTAPFTYRLYMDSLPPTLIEVGDAVVTDINDANPIVSLKAGSEPLAVPAPTASIEAKVDFLLHFITAKMIINKADLTNMPVTLRNLADGATIGARTDGEVGNNYTRGKIT